MPNYYEILGCRIGAHPAEIELAYKTITQSGAELDIEDQLDINMAFQTLMSPARRHEYNKQLQTNDSLVVPAPASSNSVYNSFYINNKENVATNINPIASTAIYTAIGYSIVGALIMILFLVWR